MNNNNKKRIKKILVSLALIIAMVATNINAGNFQTAETVYGAKKSPVKKYGKLSVEGANLVDKNGDPVQLQGVSTHGLSWYPKYVNKSGFKSLRDTWGVEVIRLAMYTAEYNGYCTGDSKNKKKLEKLIDKAVGYCKDLGLYVIIDWHILSDGNPNTYKKQSRSFFKKMAKKYADYDNVIYEICNEPNGGTSWSDIKKYADTVISDIRKYDSDGIIIVGTPTWSQDVDEAVKSPLSGDNIMYAFHFYAGTHKGELRKKLENAIKAGLPVFVTEYGICDASGSGKINKKQANSWIKLLDKYKVSNCAWNLSNKKETSAMIKKSCKKKSKWKKSDLSSSGKWVYDMIRKHRD